MYASHTKREGDTMIGLSIAKNFSGALEVFGDATWLFAVSSVLVLTAAMRMLFKNLAGIATEASKLIDALVAMQKKWRSFRGK
jgi:hypothetical protein